MNSSDESFFENAFGTGSDSVAGGSRRASAQFADSGCACRARAVSEVARKRLTKTQLCQFLFVSAGGVHSNFSVPSFVASPRIEALCAGCRCTFHQHLAFQFVVYGDALKTLNDLRM
jgi:hypothetical protein